MPRWSLSDSIPPRPGFLRCNCKVPVGATWPNELLAHRRRTPLAMEAANDDEMSKPSNPR